MQEASKPGQYDIVDRVMQGTGPLQRPPDSGYRGTNYDFVTIETKNEKGAEPVIAFHARHASAHAAKCEGNARRAR